MTKTFKLLASASLLGTAALAATPAFAAGTTSGTTITNTVTLNYQVGGVAQTPATANNTFTVDRKVNLTVAEVGNATTSVSPGEAAAVTTFTVTNSTNGAIDIGLAATQLAAAATAPHGGADAFDLSPAPLMYRDTNTNGSYDAGTDTAVT